MSDKPIVTIIGAGRSGRGMLGEMFYQEKNYSIVFADIDTGLVQGLAEQGYYTVEQKNLLTGKSRESIVKGFQIVDTVNDHLKYITYLARSEMIATALFPSAFDQVAEDLAEMIRMRKEQKNDSTAAIILGGNFVGLRQYFDKKISGSLDEDELDYFKKHIALITAKVNRKVVYPEICRKDPYFLEGDDKDILMVDNSFLFPDGYQYPSFFVLKDNMEINMIEKIWSENLRHVTFAFMGAYYGYQTINQAVNNLYIRKCAYYAWKEGRLALNEEYGLPVPDDEAVKVEFEKFASPFFRDQLSRIGREPIRKLKKNDRLVGPALLCMKHRIIPYFITRSIAYGMFYQDQNDKEAVELQSYISNHGIEHAITHFCELDMDDVMENSLFHLILCNYNEIAKTNIIPINENVTYTN